MATKVSHPRWYRYHFNAIAKEIREHFPNRETGDWDLDNADEISRSTLAGLALSLAKRFKEDREEAIAPHYEFDPIKFLDACSPDTDLYPLSELWEDE